MLKTLEQAKKLLFDEQQTTAQAQPAETQAGEPQAPAGEANDGGRSADA
jgi:hypothetical protein